MSDVQAVLEDLIHQFSDPHAFFRELIQNSIDAGSGEVDIFFEFDGDEHTEGMATIHVHDFGEGMTREIIETKLTRLFSSTKDDDLTKIGRFGIGFVSVYAIEPDAVAVDTARGGEAWRVLFKPDRTYELYALDDPLEGTQVRLYKRMSHEAFRTLVNRAVTVIKKWCAHVNVPVYVEGQDIRQAFEIDAVVQIQHEEPGTRLVAGLVGSPRAQFGFYNRGLTLSEGPESAWSGMTFKLDSRYLEHTLTRDRVLEDRHFHKVKELLDRMHQQTLPHLLMDRLEAVVEQGPGELYAKLIAALEPWVRAYPAHFKRFVSRKIFWTDAGAVSVKDLHQRELVWVSGGAAHLRHLVTRPLYGADPRNLVPILRAANLNVRLIEMAHVFPTAQRPVKPALVNSVLEISQKMKFNLREIRAGGFTYPSSPISDFWYLGLHEGETSMLSQTALDLRSAHPGVFSYIYVDVNSKEIQAIEKLAATDPRLAALALFKLWFASTPLDATTEDELMRAVYAGLASERV